MDSEPAPGLRPSREGRWRFVLLLHLAAAALWLAGDLLLRRVAPDWVRTWDLGWAIWGAAFSAAVVLPTPFEPALLLATTPSERVLAVFAAAVGVSMGTAVVYLVGDTARATLERRPPSSRVRRLLDLTAHLPLPWIYLLLGGLLAVPGLVDSGVLYIASLLGLRLRLVLLTVFLATAVRSGLVLLAGAAAGL